MAPQNNEGEEGSSGAVVRPATFLEEDYSAPIKYQLKKQSASRERPRPLTAEAGRPNHRGSVSEGGIRCGSAS
jgi:hypothetical protein